MVRNAVLGHSTCSGALRDRDNSFGFSYPPPQEPNIIAASSMSSNCSVHVACGGFFDDRKDRIPLPDHQKAIFPVGPQPRIRGGIIIMTKTCVLSLLLTALTLHAQVPERLTVEWIFSDAGANAWKMPSVTQ